MTSTSTNICRSTSASTRDSSRHPRSRSNTAHSYNDRYAAYDEPEPELERPTIRSQGRVQSSSRLEVHREYSDYPASPARPSFGRSTTFEGPRSIRATTPTSDYRKSSIPENPGMLRTQLRPSGSRVNTNYNNNGNVFGDPSDASTVDSNSPDHSYRERSVSPATSHGSFQNVTRSASHMSLSSNAGRKGPPPPPPSRAKKPPPPPPMKRADMSSNSLARY